MSVSEKDWQGHLIRVRKLMAGYADEIRSFFNEKDNVQITILCRNPKNNDSSLFISSEKDFSKINEAIDYLMNNCDREDV